MTTELTVLSRPLALKQCPDCGATCPDERKQCLACGHKF